MVGTEVAVLPGVTAVVELLVGGGFALVPPHAASKKMREQPNSARMQCENRVMRIISLRKSCKDCTFYKPASRMNRYIKMNFINIDRFLTGLYAGEGKLGR
jgi:hypothetical protein